MPTCPEAVRPTNSHLFSETTSPSIPPAGRHGHRDPATCTKDAHPHVGFFEDERTHGTQKIRGGCTKTQSSPTQPCPSLPAPVLPLPSLQPLQFLWFLSSPGLDGCVCTRSSCLPLPIQEPSRRVSVKSRNPRIYSGGVRAAPRLPEPSTFLPAESASEDPKLLATAATQLKWEPAEHGSGGPR